MSTLPTIRPAAEPSTGQDRARPGLRPWFPWLLTALAFPPAGYFGHAVAGRADSVPSAALSGVVAGVIIGLAQWALLRRRGVTAWWVAATAVGLAAGLAAGAALVSHRTDVSSLALMGAVSGLTVGLAQCGTVRGSKRGLMLWSGATAVLWAVGWSVTTAIGVDVDEQWAVFGISGALTFAFLQSFVVGAFVPAKAVKS